MRLLGGKKLARQIRDLPDSVRAELTVSINRQVSKGVRIAKVLAPVDTGELKAGIHGEVKVTKNGIYGIINAASADKDAQIKARAVEFGRTNARSSAGTRLNAGAATGSTGAQPYIRPTQAYLAKTYKAAIKRSIKKAVRSAANG